MLRTTLTSKSAMRSRWVALGAVAVSLGAGGFGIVRAAGPEGATSALEVPANRAGFRPVPRALPRRRRLIGRPR